MLLGKSSVHSTTEISLCWLNRASSFLKQISSFDMRLYSRLNAVKTANNYWIDNLVD